MSITGKKVLVLGLSKSGIAAAKFAKKHGAIVYLSEGKFVESLLNTVHILMNL